MKDTKKLKGITKASIEQPRQVPKPAIATSSKSKDDDNSDDSIDTNLGDDPENLKPFIESIKSYGVAQEDLDKINFKGGGVTRKQQYPLLQQIAKSLFQQNNSKEFLNQISDKSDGGKHKIKSVVELNKALQKLKKK